MDQATQQNAALVEEMAAAASSLRNQAHDLVQVVAVFKLTADQSHTPMAHSSAPAARSLPTPARPATSTKAPSKAATPKVTQPQAAKAPALAAAPKPAAKPASRAPQPGNDDEWESF